MGRLEYLNRLSLGLSAFHPLQAQRQVHEALTDDSRIGLSLGTSAYDSKGRPTNPRTAEHNAAQRYAQNEVLELVNIVEKKQQQATQRSEAPPSMHGSKKQAHLALLADGVRLLLTWYPQTLLYRSLLGIYGPKTSFADILARDAAETYPVALFGGLGGLLSGLNLYIIHAVLSTMYNTGVETLSAELPRLIDPIKYRPIINATLSVLAALEPGFELCLMPVLHLALSARLDLVRPRGIYNLIPMLVGYTRLFSSSISHLDRSLMRTYLALPILLAIRRENTRTFMQRASQSHGHQQRVLAQSAHESSPMSPLLRAFRQVSLAIPRLRNEDNLADHAREALTTAAGQVCHPDDWATQANKVHSRIPSLASMILRRLTQLPLDWIIIQLSARAFNIIVGPFDDSGCTTDLPIYRISGALNRPDTILAYSSKVGLALGFTLAVETIVRCVASRMICASTAHKDAGHHHNNR